MVRKGKKCIFSLKDGENTITRDENLLIHAIEYYKSLFGRSEGNVFDLDPNLWSEVEKVTEEENINLTRPFDEEEIKRALFMTENNKAAGPDKIPTEFYQSSWEIIKKDIVELFNDFFLGKLDIQRLNYGIITLIPRSNEATKYSNTTLFAC